MKNYLLLHNLDFKAIPSQVSTDPDVTNIEHLQQLSPSSQSWQSTKQRSRTIHCE